MHISNQHPKFSLHIRTLRGHLLHRSGDSRGGINSLGRSSRNGHIARLLRVKDIIIIVIVVVIASETIQGAVRSIAVVKEGPNEVHSASSEDSASSAKEERSDDAENILGSVPHRAESYG